jgi:hypothetical protein
MSAETQVKRSVFAGCSSSYDFCSKCIKASETIIRQGVLIYKLSETRAKSLCPNFSIEPGNEVDEKALDLMNGVKDELIKENRMPVYMKAAYNLCISFLFLLFVFCRLCVCWFVCCLFVVVCCGLLLVVRRCRCSSFVVCCALYVCWLLPVACC